ncbi:MAG TPA: signal peptidase I, partial [Terrimesophilobacter sp.]|nr:signal peptidase I [Terrimesophilobacter sp.]
MRDTIVIVLCAVLISVAIKTFLVRSFYIPTGSMKDTLQIDDRILVNQLVPGLMELQRGDVIVFQDPGGWLHNQPSQEQTGFLAWVDWLLTQIGLSAADSNDHLIKRVIGMPGDTVICCNQFGQLTVNGVPIQENYLRLPAGVSAASGIEFNVTVPQGSLWV